MGFAFSTSYSASCLITHWRFFRTRIMPYSCLFLEVPWRVPDTQVVFNEIITEWMNDPWNVEEEAESKGPLRCLAWVNQWKWELMTRSTLGTSKLVWLWMCWVWSAIASLGWGIQWVTGKTGPQLRKSTRMPSLTFIGSWFLPTYRGVC